MNLPLSTTPSWYHQRRRCLALLAFALLVITAPGCGDDDDDPMDPAQPSTVEGRVDGDAGFGKSAAIEGAIVTLARVQANGSLQTISVDTVHTDAQGQFAVETMSAGERQNVVVATKEGVTWKSIVTAETSAGGMVQSQPLNDESTVEADVHARVIANGTTNASFYTDVAADVDADVTVLVRGNAAKLDQVAEAIEAEAETHVLFLSDSSIAVTQTQLQTIASGRIEAHEDLEAALDADADSAAVAASMEQFYDALLDAHIDAQVSAGVAAQAREAGARALMRMSSTLDADTRFALARTATRARARFIDAAVRARLTSLGAGPGEIAAATSAGTLLVASVDNASSIASIDSAFADYHDEILDALQATVEAHSVAIGMLDASIRGVGGAKLALETALDTASSTTAIARAYGDFHETVSTITFAALVGATTADATAIAEILTITNMSFSMF